MVDEYANDVVIGIINNLCSDSSMVDEYFGACINH